jgi:hypothetical protein
MPILSEKPYTRSEVVRKEYPVIPLSIFTSSERQETRVVLATPHINYGPVTIHTFEDIRDKRTGEITGSTTRTTYGEPDDLEYGFQVQETSNDNPAHLRHITSYRHYPQSDFDSLHTKDFEAFLDELIELQPQTAVLAEA